MTSQYGTRYAIIRLLRGGREQGYHAVTWAEGSQHRTLIGYFRTLKGRDVLGAPALAPHAREARRHQRRLKQREVVRRCPGTGPSFRRRPNRP